LLFVICYLLFATDATLGANPLGRSIDTPGGSDLFCKLTKALAACTGSVEYFQLSLFGDNLGLLKTPPLCDSGIL